MKLCKLLLIHVILLIVSELICLLGLFITNEEIHIRIILTGEAQF